MVSYIRIAAAVILLLWGCETVDREKNREEPLLEVPSPKEESFSLRDQEGWVEMQALSAAYPEVGPVQWGGKDLYFVLKGQRFYWAGGRLLPEADLGHNEDYAPYSFYPYPDKLPPIQELSVEQKERLQRRLEERKVNPPKRNEAFLETLWELEDQNSAWAQQKTIFFLGHQVQIHRFLLEDLARVEDRILTAAEKDQELKAFLDTFYRVDAYNWRNIASTASRSLHSYGIALDIIPIGKIFYRSYWHWIAEEEEEWYYYPYEKRYMPPEAFVEAFEAEGFIWGGKWFFFDTIHFEYRPEILLR